MHYKELAYLFQQFLQTLYRKKLKIDYLHYLIFSYIRYNGHTLDSSWMCMAMKDTMDMQRRCEEGVGLWKHNGRVMDTCLWSV